MRRWSMLYLAAGAAGDDCGQNVLFLMIVKDDAQMTSKTKSNLPDSVVSLP